MTTREEGLRKKQNSLLLAASDMDQAIAAATALLEEDQDGALARAYETALVVCYMRPFMSGSGRLPNRYIPKADAKVVHDGLRKVRHEIYAHTSEASGRTTEMQIESEGEIFNLSWREQWLPLSRDDVRVALSLFEQQRDLFRQDACEIQVELERA
jgi:hypothetical protein